MKDLDLSEIVSDESFLNYCFKRNREDVEYWENWLALHPGHQRELAALKVSILLMAAPIAEKVISSDYTRLQQTIADRRKRSYVAVKLWPYISVAASIALMIVGGYFYITSKKLSSTYAIDVSPGTQSATLTLGNGKKIRLSTAPNGQLANEPGVAIIKTAKAGLVYEIKDSAVQSSQTNTLSTANGETYQVRLPDGTAVWLNAASSISYPSSFASLKTRKVAITGEAYFEVAKDKVHPFIVESNGQQVEVLGTHFNINSYANEMQVKTTLLEGSVKIKGNVGKEGVLSPGQQGVIASNGELNIAEVDTELAVAWKNNKFIFASQQIKDIMRMVERWYNVKVVYQNRVPEDRFTGKVSRFDNVSQVLKILEESGGVHFKVVDDANKGKVIYVSN